MRWTKTAALTVLFSIVEVVTLLYWFMAAKGTAYNGVIVVLFVGLYIEHLLTQITYSGSLTKKAAGLWAINSAFETVVWGVWQSVLSTPVLAGAVILVGLGIEHTLSENILTGKGIASRLLSRSVVGITVIEAVGAAVLSGVGALVLPARGVVMLILSVAEHQDELALAKRGG